ncbi:MAG TPA: major capsid protein [Gemmatimonadales bacterium]|nr:major capsid protein [Gemmatimonadales bacterium]
MPQPSISDVHVNRPLTNLSVAFMQRADAFLAATVFPRVPVDKRSNLYFTYDRTFWFRSDAQRRAPGTESAGGAYGITTASYSADRWAFHKDIDDPTRENADEALNLDREATEYVAAQLMLRQEIDWAAKYFKTGVWTGAPTVATKWDDAASTPIEDINGQSRAIESITGYYPNSLVLGRKTFDNLRQHPDLIDRIKYSAGPGNPAIVNEQTMAQLFGVERVMVAKAVQNTAAEGVPGSYSYVVDQKSALLVYTAGSPGLMTPTAGYTFTWSGAPGANNGFGVRIKRFRMEWRESDRVEGEFWYDQKVVAADLGSFFNGVVS